MSKVKERVKGNARKIEKLAKNVKSKSEARANGCEGVLTSKPAIDSPSWRPLTRPRPMNAPLTTDWKMYLFREERHKMRGNVVLKRKAKGSRKSMLKLSVRPWSGVRETSFLIVRMEHCCYPNPGFTAERLQQRLPRMIAKCDDAIVILCGTNNVPQDFVGTAITKINNQVKAARAQNRDAHIPLSEIPIRFHNIALNEKIDKINIFIRHACSKSDRLHVLKHHNMFPSDFGRDGLHFSLAGKQKFATTVKRSLHKIFGTK